MQKNMGSIDRSVRTIAAVLIAGLLLTGQITGVVGTILGVLTVVFLVTSLLGFCPLYLPFRFSTRKEIALREK